MKNVKNKYKRQWIFLYEKMEQNNIEEYEEESEDYTYTGDSDMMEQDYFSSYSDEEISSDLLNLKQCSQNR